RDAAAFAADLARLPAREPVAAEPLGPWLRARRWCERRPALAVAIGLGALLVVLVPTALLVQQHRYAGRLERSLADARTAHAQAEEVVRFLLDAFGEVNPERNGGRQPTAMDVLDAAAEKLGAELADRPVDRARLSYSIAKVRHHLGDDRGALPLLDGLMETLDGVEASWVEPLRGAALALRSAVHLNLDRVDEAEGDALRAREWAAGAPDEVVPPEVGGYLGVLAAVRRRQQRPGEELELRRRALAELERRGAGPAFAARERVTLVGALLKAGRFEEARSEAEATLAILRSADGARPSDLAVALNAFGLAHRKLGRGEEARAAYEEALALQREVFGPEAPAARMTEANLAGLLEMKGEFEAAGRAYLALADWFAAYYRPEHAYAVLLRGNGAGCLFRAGFHAEVVPIYEALIPLQRRAYGDDHAYVAASMGKLGKALFETGRPAEAIPKLRAAADASEATENFAFAVGCLAEASGAALAIGDETAARTLAARAVSLIDAHGVTHPAEESLRNTAR
ncbi:MAG: tetratricopeptide repeat protein, partial [Planctomycetota bacterium JB042]